MLCHRLWSFAVVTLQEFTDVMTIKIIIIKNYYKSDQSQYINCSIQNDGWWLTGDASWGKKEVEKNEWII